MLDQLHPRRGSQHRPRRLGRGPGSGSGKTSGRGMKGQGHRSAGRETPLWFEGGQMPITRRVPKRGFFNLHRKECSIVNLTALQGFSAGDTVDVEMLHQRGLIPKADRPVKLLGQGDAPKGITIKVHRVSASARKKIEAAGGTVEIIQ